jgi:hypothetical protein
MKRTTVWTILASITTTVAVSVAAVPAQAAAQVPLGAPVSAAQAVGGQRLGSVVIPDTCPQLERQLPALARQGQRWAGCITPAPAPSVRPAATAGVAAASIALPSWCTAGSWWAQRTEICQGGTAASLTWKDASSGKVLGTAQFLILQDLQLSPLGRTFAENFELQVTSVTGQLPGATVNLAVSCGGTCTATSHFPNGSAIAQGSDITTAIDYSDSTATVNTTTSEYALTWGPGTTNPVTWPSPSYRCDNLIPTQGAGCVSPDYIPTMTSMASLPNIAANIGDIQQAGPHHYGRKADGLPLTRNSSLYPKNRDAACPPNAPRPDGKSCDEYPFATTDQGASQTTPPDCGSAMVPNDEQSQQGGFVSGFYRQERVLDGTNGTGDKFWVAV